MNRRQFVKTAALATAGVIAAPYILPGGRLFARSGARLANHVVFVLFGGGLRNQETVNRQYLANQGLPTQGNVMPNMLSGAQPGANLVYQKWNPVLPTPLSQQGTLFQEVLYKNGPTGHFNGHTVAMTGAYTETGLNLNVNPDFPTVFEYYRKHSDPSRSAMNAWWLSESLG
ncbi:MAG: twin-arginine translocation signal domain-containing protein, partial [Bacteroidota bacterium]|nr:twin-arginine translocation signal domain-containing protein [Bacteroidota bacterium]